MADDNRGNTQVPDPAGGYATINEPLRSDFPSNLGGAVEYRLAHVIYAVLRITGGGLGEFFGSFLVHTLEILRPELVRYVSPMLDELLEIPDLPPGFKQFLENVRDADGQAAAALLTGIGSTAGGAAIGGLIPTLLSPATYALAGAMTPARPSPAEAWSMRWREIFDENTLNDQLRDQGWHEDTIAAFGAILRPRPAVTDLYRWAQREGIRFTAIEPELRARGWVDEDIRKIETLVQQIPGPGDQVRFALREAWRDDVAGKFGYDEDSPPEFAEWMGKLGFDPIWARNFWRSHWDLPSIQAGFEMLHRRVIDEGELDTLLRVADMPSFWRENLKQISYRPYTRVDVRRMHSMGILSESQLIDAYRDLGFDSEHALGMAEFTVAYNARSDNEYSKGEILQGYRLRAISAIQAHTLLLQTGQSAEYADYVLSLEDYKVANTLQKAQIEIIEDRYVMGDIDTVAATSQLGELDLRGEQIAVLFQEWEILKEKAIARPSRSDVRNFYKLGIIEREGVRGELVKRHVPVLVIGWYLEQWDSEIAEEAGKELEREQKEQERLEGATFRTDRMIAVQGINVLIAEQRTIIADARLALTEIRPPEEVEILQNLIKELQVNIRQREEQIQAQRTLITSIEFTVRSTPELNLLEELEGNIDGTQEAIAALRVLREDLQTQIAVLEVVVVEQGDTIIGLEAEIEQARLAVVIEEYETEIAIHQEYITFTRNLLATTPEPEMLEEMRRQIAGLKEDVMELRGTIASIRTRIAMTNAELVRMPTPEQAEEFRVGILEAKAEISRLQLVKARIPITPT